MHEFGRLYDSSRSRKIGVAFTLGPSNGMSSSACYFIDTSAFKLGLELGLLPRDGFNQEGVFP